MMQFRKNLKNTQRGAIFVMFAILLPTILLVMGLAIDLGYLYVMRSKLQDVADATALAGAMQMHGSEGRYTGGAESDDKNTLVVGKAIADFVKVNDNAFAEFSAESVEKLVYKGTYRDYTGGSVNETTNNLDDSGHSFVKLVDLESWTDSSKGPMLAADLSCKIEYAISGRLNARNFLDANVDENNNIVSDYTSDDRVRVRLTKRLPLAFLNIILSEQYAKGVPLTVTAAAKAQEGGGTFSSEEINTKIKLPVLSANNAYSYNNIILNDIGKHLSFLGKDDESIEMLAYNINNVDYNLDNVKTLGAGYFAQPYLSINNTSQRFLSDSRYEVFRVGDRVLVAVGKQGITNQAVLGSKEHFVGYDKSGGYSAEAIFQRYDRATNQWVAIDKGTTASSNDKEYTRLLGIWIKDINNIASYSAYSVALNTSGAIHLDNNNRTNRIYKRNSEFNVNDFRMVVRTVNQNQFIAGVVNDSSRMFNGALLTDYHLAYRNNYEGYADDDYTNANYIKDVKVLKFEGDAVIATTGVTYGDIYCGGQLYILGENNVFTGTIYANNDLHVGGKNNVFFPTATEQQTGMWCNDLKFDCYISSVDAGDLKAQNIKVTSNQQANNEFKLIFGSGEWSRRLPGVKESTGLILVE